MRPRDENKEGAIRQKAMEIVVNEGFDGLSMGKLAKAAKVSPATIYIYFKDREDLLLQLCVKEAENLVQETFKNFDPEMSFEEGMKVQWKNRANFWKKNPVNARFLEHAKNSPYGKKASKIAKKEFNKIMSAFANGALERGELKSMSPETFWSLGFAPLYSLLNFHLQGFGLRGKKFQLDNKTLDATLRSVLKALSPN